VKVILFLHHICIGNLFNMDSQDERRDRIVGEDRADNVNGHTERPRGSGHEGRPSGDRKELFDLFGLFRSYFDSQLSSLY
jgi:hypothetical protein